MAKKKDNTVEIGFEEQIWSAADKLRGNIDASEYKNVVLGLIFLKYISDKFDQKYQELVEEGEGFEEDRDEYASENIFFVPESARWKTIAAAAHTPEIGKAIDELIVHGQINGGILQSLGYGSMEKLEVKGGRFKQKSMSDYVIPTSMDFPKQFYHIQENPYPWGPYGAKGMGELVFNGASAAYVDAVERALNTRFTSIPIPPEVIEEAMKHVH